MKKITKSKLVLLCTIMWCSFTFAQATDASYVPTSDVPSIIIEKQELLFSDVYTENWTASGDDLINPEIYIAHYKDKGVGGYSATYHKDGSLLYTSKFLSEDLLPETVIIKVRSEFDSFEIQHGYRIMLQDPKRTIIRVDLLDNNRLQYAYFTNYGVLIPKNTLPRELRFSEM